MKVLIIYICFCFKVHLTGFCALISVKEKETSKKRLTVSEYKSTPGGTRYAAWHVSKR